MSYSDLRAHRGSEVGQYFASCSEVCCCPFTRKLFEPSRSSKAWVMKWLVDHTPWRQILKWLLSVRNGTVTCSFDSWLLVTGARGTNIWYYPFEYFKDYASYCGVYVTA